ncbi:TPA: hypothetical protein EYP12_05510 [Candidatus Bipolaricaulota bacterium]|nr:hypothetical protein [Candidatus Bipolaricaulota bacterium]
MNIRRLFKKKAAIPAGRLTGGPDREDDNDNVDSKDILAFIIALYQLFAPLLLGLLISGTIVSLIILFLFD